MKYGFDEDELNRVQRVKWMDLLVGNCGEGDHGEDEHKEETWFFDQL